MWITTASGLDWPKSQNIREQQSSLIEIVGTLKQYNFNTIFFQVRARGDAYYRSSYEPWAENLTGSPGKDPGYDPLALLVDEAHRQGMEVHAWFNLYKVGNPGPTLENHIRHVARSHPDWVYRYGEEVWLNPGNPQVNDYLIRVALEIARNYDIDGIQFDFIRYPGLHIPDKAEYLKHGGGTSLADWRRENISRFVEAFYDSAAVVRPLLKVGATPVGNFGNGLPSGFSELYQDATAWMERGKVDYVVPQIYWDLGSSPTDPDFAALARRWCRAANGRHTYAGIGAYKTEVLEELAEQVDSSRATGCMGQAFFRLGNMADFSALQNRYAQPAAIPEMAWKRQNPSPGSKQLAVTEVSPGIYHLEWTKPESGEIVPISYRVYRSASPSIAYGDTSSLLGTTEGHATFFMDTTGSSGGLHRYYAITAIDPKGRESLPSPVVASSPRKFEKLLEIVKLPVSLSASIDTQDNSRILIAYSLPGKLPVSIILQQDARQTTNPLLTNLVGEVKSAGTYILGVDRREFPPGDYFVVLRAGDITINRRLVLGPL